MRLSRSLITILLLNAIAASGFLSCSQNVAQDAEQGVLTVAIGNKINARTLIPAIDMTAANYTIMGTGPNGAAFTITTSSTAATKSGLEFGDWSIVVNALNAASILIGTGSASVLVNSGPPPTAVSVSVLPIGGTGTLSLSADWPSGIQNPSIVASLTPALGVAVNLPFTFAGQTATYLSTAQGIGYYTLSLTLLDGLVPVAGAVEVIRIVSGQTTSGSYSAVNMVPGSLTFTINANLQNPLDVVLGGAAALLAHGSVLPLEASVTNYGGSIAYGWYVNGVSVGAGASYSFGSTQATGYYRVDVTAMRADGTQAGSASTNVNVALVNLGTVNNYAIFAGSAAITIGTLSGVTGNVGLNMGSTGLIGFGAGINTSNTFSTSSLVIGNIYANDNAVPTPAALATASTDMNVAYDDVVGRASPVGTDLGNGELGGLIITPGLYKWTTAATISSTLTLNGGPNDVWIFQIGGALTVSSSTSVLLVGVDPTHIFWQTVGAVTLNDNSVFSGIVLSNTAITTGSNAVVHGRLFAKTAITIGDGSTVIQP